MPGVVVSQKLSPIVTITWDSPSQVPWPTETGGQGKYPGWQSQKAVHQTCVKASLLGDTGSLELSGESAKMLPTSWEEAESEHIEGTHRKKGGKNVGTLWLE